MEVKIDRCFSSIENDDRSQVFEVFPKVFNDGRGSFSEVLKTESGWETGTDIPLWFSNLTWIRQVNRSVSEGNVVRGCHAQKGSFCQGKLVESVQGKIFDIITDARPDSETFGVSKVYILDSEKQNKVWVPRGFLHSFITPNTESKYIFMYFVDNIYNKESEIGINPTTLLPSVVENMNSTIDTDNHEYDDLFEVFSNTDKINYSDKDRNGLNYEKFMCVSKEEYVKLGKNWFK